MVVVVPGLAEGREREPGEVARLVAGAEAAAAEEVAEGVDREGRVVQEEDAHRATPQQPRQAADDRTGQRDAETEGDGEAR